MTILEELNLSKEPTNLTKEQRQIIQEALNSIPKERIETMTEYSFLTKKYCTWEGIEEQLERGNKIVYYSDYRDIPSEYRSKICKMRVCE